MFLRSLFAATLTVAAVTAADPAGAWSARASVSIVLRDGPGTDAGRLTVIPAGATVEVYKCAGWCEVLYNGVPGFVYGRYLHRPLRQTVFLSPVRTPQGTYLSPVYVPPQTAYIASAPFRPPSTERADWYQGRALYYNGRFFDRPDLFFIYGR
ncbi:MAG TPA: SH3 domain-containing protein [Bauldia sp.]|nr:SH3 domain-containing protein [Bauldia sp.]